MEQFNALRIIIKKRYIKFKPVFAFIHTAFGVQMLTKLHKYNVELLISEDEEYYSVRNKIDSLIVIAKNKKKNNSYCMCGYSLNRYTEYNRCNCGNSTCMHCVFSQFKINQGEITCYNCLNTLTKRVKKNTLFTEIFNDILKDYIDKSNDTELEDLLI